MSDDHKPAVADVLGIAGATSSALETVREPVRTLLGPAWSELAGALGDGVKHWRDMRRLERAAAAVRKIRGKGISPKAVDPSILFPLLDAASLVDDETLKEKWDSLLANAADSCGAEVLPSFPALLSQLSPLEAQMLDSMFDASPHSATLSWRRIPIDPGGTRAGDPYRADILVSKKEVKKSYGLDPTQFRVITDNLIRLRILEMTPMLIGETRVVQSDSNKFRLTALGRAFLKACHYED